MRLIIVIPTLQHSSCIVLVSSGFMSSNQIQHFMKFSVSIGKQNIGAQIVSFAGPLSRWVLEGTGISGVNSTIPIAVSPRV